jgi:hypothetical protein
MVSPRKYGAAWETLATGRNDRITGSSVPCSTRLIYVSKNLESLRQERGGLAVEVISKAMARMAFHSDTPGVMVGADYQDWHRRCGHELEAHVTSGRTVVLRKARTSGFGIVRAAARVLDFNETSSTVSLTLENPAADSTLRFRTDNPPRRVLVNGKPVNVSRAGDEWEAPLPAMQGKVAVVVEL